MAFFLISVVVVFGQDSDGDFGGGRQEWYCNQLDIEDCMDHILDQRCGTDGVTYYNT